MSDSEAVVSLPEAQPEQLAAAVQAAVTANSELTAQLRDGAQQSTRDEPTDAAVARRFQTMLELGYLAASADGFADAERASLALLLEQLTAKAIDHAALELHFRDLDEAVATMGRRERLARAAADLDDPATASEAVGLVAMIAMADGVLSGPEYGVLVELGEHLGLPASKIHTLVDQAATRVKKAMR